MNDDFLELNWDYSVDSVEIETKTNRTIAKLDDLNRKILEEIERLSAEIKELKEENEYLHRKCDEFVHKI